jgi:hypothetical protein
MLTQEELEVCAKAADEYNPGEGYSTVDTDGHPAPDQALLWDRRNRGQPIGECMNEVCDALGITTMKYLIVLNKSPKSIATLFRQKILESVGMEAIR